MTLEGLIAEVQCLKYRNGICWEDESYTYPHKHPSCIAADMRNRSAEYVEALGGELIRGWSSHSTDVYALRHGSVH